MNGPRRNPDAVRAFADRVRQLQGDVSQNELARRAGSCPARLSRILSGARTLGPTDVDRLSAALGVSSQDLVGDLVSTFAPRAVVESLQRQLGEALAEAASAIARAERMSVEVASAVTRERRLRDLLDAERGLRGPEGWTCVFGRWRRVIREDPLARLWAIEMSEAKGGVRWSWTAGLSDAALHPGEDDPLEIAEWTVHAEGPWEVMEAAEERYRIWTKRSRRRARTVEVISLQSEGES